MILSHPLSTAIPSIKDDEDIKDLETIRKTLLPIYHDYPDVFFWFELTSSHLTGLKIIILNLKVLHLFQAQSILSQSIKYRFSCSHCIKEGCLYARLSKCKFHNSSLQFLGVIIASNGISMDLAMDLPKPTSVKTLQAFTVTPILAHFSELTQNLIETDVVIPMDQHTEKDIKKVKKQEYYFRFRISAQNNPRSLPYKTPEISTLLKENSNRTFVEQLEGQNRIFSAHSLQKPGQNSPVNME
ncbi:uncharacterized protein VP01_6417g1 [Puccinia sorghi]|uniref:Uncharacterized protein n=1 Tax=Puccinia sorghi TaxID=27349 RepID=A0A0L6UFV8_9BASI|nr:uncharacterized protein VP01_6417g1 [Puccinia sorghi]